MTDARHFAPATARNREPIFEVLSRLLPPSGTVLEIASGSGEHAAWFAPRLPHLVWQPSDADSRALASIAAWAEDVGAANLRAPLHLDAAVPPWPVAEPVAAIFNANMIHISAWATALGLLAEAGRLLAIGGKLILYGPFKVDGQHTAPSNEAFDQSLRERNPAWGVRDRTVVAEAAARHGLLLDEIVAMPANNQILVFVRG